MSKEQREFEELCKNNPNYPKNFELHKMYQSHIKKWKPLIDSNDPSIYSDWNTSNMIDKWNGFTDRYLTWLFNNPIVSKSRFGESNQFGLKSIDLITKMVLDDDKVRRELMELTMQSYIFMIENISGDNRLYYSWGSDKRFLIEYFDHISDGVNNPFDLVFGKTKPNRNPNYNFWGPGGFTLAKFIAIVVALLGGVSVLLTMITLSFVPIVVYVCCFGFYLIVLKNLDPR